MTGIDGRVNGLSTQVYDTLKGMNVREGISKTDAAKLKAAILADGKVDEAENDLLEELFAGQHKLTIDTGASSSSVPLELSFVDVMPGESPLQPDAARELAEVKIAELSAEAEETAGEENTEDGFHKEAKHFQHIFHEMHLGAEATENLVHFLKTSPKLTAVLKFLPKPAEGKILEMLAEVGGKYGNKALHSLGKALESKLVKGIAIAADAYGAGYYGTLASGLNYPNVNIDGANYECRPSTRTKALAGITAGLNVGSLAGTATGVGAGAAIGLSVAGLVSGAITDWSLDRDKELMTDVVNKVMKAKTGAEMKHGIESLRAEYGSLSEVQEVLGEVAINQKDGQVIKVDDNHTKGLGVDRELVGAVANRILEFGVKGELPEADAQKAIGELLGGASHRWWSDDNVAQSFVNQIFLKFGHDEKDFTKALKLLGSDSRLQLFKMLDSGVTWGKTGNKTLDWMMNESSKDLSEARVMEFLANIEPDVKTRGKMIATLMDGFTRQRFENLAFKLIDKTYKESVRANDFGNFNKLLNEIKLDGDAATRMTDLSNELDAGRAGKILAWMASSGAPRDQVEKYVAALSSHWTDNDNITSAFMAEANRLKLDPAKLANALSQESVRKLMGNLEGGWTDDAEYGQIEKLAQSCDAASKAYIIERMIKGPTFKRAEDAIANILDQAHGQQFKTLLEKLNTKDLGSELSDSRAYGKAMHKILASGDDIKTAGYINGGDAAAVLGAWAGTTVAERSRLGDQSRTALFRKFVDGGRFAEAREMISGSQSDLSRKDMASYFARHATNFSNSTEAGKAAAWVLAYGSQADVDTAFGQIKSKWFGKAGEIVKAAIDQGQASHLDLRGKLSMPTLTSMTGSLNTAWTKMFGDYGENLKYVRALASLTPTEGKAAIVKDLMDYWTPGQAETLIHDIFKDSANPHDFSQLVDKVGPARISSELENRRELGQVMAYIAQRYEGDKDKALNQIMSKWSNFSIQSDDIVQAMLEELAGGKVLNDSRFNAGQARTALRGVSNATIDKLIDWSNDAFRDGNAISLDPETQATLKHLKASKR